MQHQTAQGKALRMKIIDNLSAWGAVVLAAYLLLENWDLVSPPIRGYLIGHFPEYIDLLMLAAPVVTWLGVYLAIHLAISTTLSKVYNTIQGTH